jgi:hypothetical protein
MTEKKNQVEIISMVGGRFYENDQGNREEDDRRDEREMQMHLLLLCVHFLCFFIRRARNKEKTNRCDLRGRERDSEKRETMREH